MTQQKTVDRLTDIIDQIGTLDSTLHEIHPLLMISGPEAKDQMMLTRRLVFQDLCELSALLAMLVETISELRNVNKQTRQPTKIDLSPDSPQGDAAVRQFTLSDRTSILIKVVYEWLYHLREDLGSHANVKGAILKQHWESLNKCCLFRKELVTHRQTRQIYSVAGVRFSEDYVDIELILVPIFELPLNSRALLSKVFDEAVPFLPIEKRNETNEIERIAILYRSSDVLPGPIRGKISKLVHTVGAVSDLPLELVKLIHNLTTDFASSIKTKPAAS